jgi:hypothetical protein
LQPDPAAQLFGAQFREPTEHNNAILFSLMLWRDEIVAHGVVVQ